MRLRVAEPDGRFTRMAAHDNGMDQGDDEVVMIGMIEAKVNLPLAAVLGWARIFGFFSMTRERALVVLWSSPSKGTR